MSDQTDERKTQPAPVETLIDRERIRGASRMIAEGTDAKDVTAEQIQAVSADTDLFMRAHGLNGKMVSRAIGYSPAVVSEFLAGKYKGNNGRLAIDLESWLVEEGQRRARPQTTQFVWTNVARQIKGVASYCLDKRTIGLVYGPDTTGIGKTTAMQAIYQELGRRRSSLVTIDKVDANPTGLLKNICRAMGRDDSGSNHTKFDRIVRHITGKSHLLLIDQVHNLRWSKDDKPFYILADLYDRTNTAQLWCGTADLVAYLERQQRKHADESLAQLRRRIFPRVDLMDLLNSSGGGGGGDLLVTVEQVRKMFAKNKLKITDAAARFLCELCNTPDSGSVGLCVQIVEYATWLGEKERVASIDVRLLKEALRLGFTPGRTEILLKRIADDEGARTAIARAG